MPAATLIATCSEGQIFLPVHPVHKTRQFRLLVRKMGTGEKGEKIRKVPYLLGFTGYLPWNQGVAKMGVVESLPVRHIPSGTYVLHRNSPGRSLHSGLGSIEDHAQHLRSRNDE